MCEEHGGRPAVERVRERNAAVGALPSRLRLGCAGGLAEGLLRLFHRWPALGCVVQWVFQQACPAL